MISVEELRRYLQLHGVNTEDISDQDLEDLITLTLEEIEVITGAPISSPRSINEYEPSFINGIYVTDYYPITEPEIELDGEIVTANHIDYDKGIIYFKPKISGELTVSYNIQVLDEALINNLIANMIIKNLEGDSLNRSYSSVKEGDVSVTYASGTGLDVESKIEDGLRKLSGYFKPRARLY